MPTVTHPESLQLGTLELTTRALRCFDFADLYRTASRGGDFDTPGGLAVAVDREPAPLSALLRIRINGRWTYATDVSSGATEAAWRSEAYTTWQLLHDAAETVTAQTLTLADTDAAVSVSAPVYTETVTVDRRDNPWLWVCSLEVTIPSGTLF